MSKKFHKFGSSPINYRKMVFMDKDKEEEWDTLDPSMKSFLISHLNETCDKLEIKQALDLICLVIVDLQKRLDKLEEKQP